VDTGGKGMLEDLYGFFLGVAVDRPDAETACISPSVIAVVYAFAY
jgi:hypothetical protein